jgi:hypothetical protein
MIALFMIEILFVELSLYVSRIQVKYKLKVYQQSSAALLLCGSAAPSLSSIVCLSAAK